MEMRPGDRVGSLRVLGDVSKLPGQTDRAVADVFMLREMDGLDTVQICEALRISQNNLWVNVPPGAHGAARMFGVDLVWKEARGLPASVPSRR